MKLCTGVWNSKHTSCCKADLISKPGMSNPPDNASFACFPYRNSSFIKPTVHGRRTPSCGNTSSIERALFLRQTGLHDSGDTIRVLSLQCFIRLLEPNLLTPLCDIKCHIIVYQRAFWHHEETSVRRRVSIVSVFSADADNICQSKCRQRDYQLALAYR